MKAKMKAALLTAIVILILLQLSQGFEIPLVLKLSKRHRIRSKGMALGKNGSAYSNHHKLKVNDKQSQLPHRNRNFYLFTGNDSNDEYDYSSNESPNGTKVKLKDDDQPNGFGSSLSNGDQGGIDGGDDGTNRYTTNSFPPFPREAFDINTLADDIKTPLFFPELKVMDFQRATRLLKERSYARKDPFLSDNLNTKPTIQDLASPPSNNLDKLWVSSWFRLVVGLTSWTVFPFMTMYVYDLAKNSVGGQEFIAAEVAFNLSSFLPSVSLIYGTFISLTLSILYNRQKYILDKVECETSLLVVTTENILTVFDEDDNDDDNDDVDDDQRIVEIGQCIADYVRLLVMESRGTELMTIMYSDPLVRLLNALAKEKKRQIKTTGIYDSAIDTIRSDIKDLFKVRAQRLGSESSSLPPTHFALMSILTGILLASFTFSTLPTLSNEGLPSPETRFLFSVFTTVYVIFATFAADLNNPFKGVYQIRRSGPAAHLLQTKMLLLNDTRMKDKIFFDR